DPDAEPTEAGEALEPFARAAQGAVVSRPGVALLPGDLLPQVGCGAVVEQLAHPPHGSDDIVGVLPRRDLCSVGNFRLLAEGLDAQLSVAELVVPHVGGVTADTVVQPGRQVGEAALEE